MASAPLPLFDPHYLEIAKTLFAGLSAVAASIGVWQKFRDKRQATKAFDQVFTEKRLSGEANRAAQQLLTLIPPDVIEKIEKRAENCWAGYRQVLDGDFLPTEIDHATVSVQACVCRELGRINTLNGSIPERWKGQWERFGCV